MDEQNINQKDLYFAAREPKEKASTLLQKASSFFTVMKSNAYLDKIHKMWRAYHGMYNTNYGDGHEINFTGEQGELVSLPVNHFRNLAQHMYNMITSNRPVMQARAVNTDYKSLSQTYLADGILDYYMREKNLEDALQKAVELAIVMGSGFVKLEWNSTSGEAYDYDEETKQYNYEGELEFSNLSALDVVVDGTKESWNHDWMLTRTFQNRYNLMAKYPELADKIRGLPSKTDSNVFRLALFSNDDTDDIPIYEFYHKKTEAMPDGNYMLFLSDEIVLLDTKLPYRTIPIFRISPSDFLGTPYGYTPMFDIFPIQEGINALYSTILTNQNAFGVQNIFVQRGSDININSLDGAMNIIEANFEPKPLNLTETPTEVFKFLEMLIQSAETISGINSVARGNPEASLHSGNALALVQSMALQYISGLQKGYIKLVEDVGTSLISILKDFANTPKVVALVGKNNRSLLKEFTGEDVSEINRVIVDVGNPLARTTAGRVQMAEQMLQMGIIKQPEQYFQVLNTGRLDAIYEGEMKEILLVKAENEDLSSGINPPVAPTDEHSLHISEHRAVLASPELRKDPALRKAVMDHIQMHLDMLRQVDPDLLMLLKQQPLAPAGMSQPGFAAGGPQQAPGAPQGDEQNADVLAAQQGQPQPGDTIKGPGQEQGEHLPNLPKVAGSLLPDPSLQEQSLGNVK